MTGARSYTKAMLIARSRLNEFRAARMRGTDLTMEPVKEYEGFWYNRVTTRYEHPLFGELQAKRTEITVIWRENDREKKYSISFIYPANQ
jgi:hypothetical protein